MNTCSKFVAAVLGVAVATVTIGDASAKTVAKTPVKSVATHAVAAHKTVKLAGHLHTKEARDYAVDAGKPSVLLTGGYNPERVASEIMDQVANRLRA